MTLFMVNAAKMWKKEVIRVCLFLFLQANVLCAATRLPVPNLQSSDPQSGDRESGTLIGERLSHTLSKLDLVTKTRRASQEVRREGRWFLGHKKTIFSDYLESVGFHHLVTCTLTGSSRGARGGDVSASQLEFELNDGRLQTESQSEWKFGL